ncbi:MAG: ATP-binding cassette domain-containing protein [Desulfocapsa sp.]|uniref:ATP-binding cassette domain-containing protein n=1 Tax=Desulfotalea psychrophila TaxID=84980 RepID=A0ABS3AUG3_9BACT|nr:ATP-binding cassette domain-containing protein [Desulfocapsa sp.]MBN4068403.1 ATP-binding cassette domain-containing protein [Desulfotalea psychrophila]
MLEAKSLIFRYQPATPLLEGINLTIHPGEIVGLPGASGCGKSTFGRLLAGYLSPQGGKVLYENSPLPNSGYCPVQMVFQHPEASMNPRWKIKKILTEGNQDYTAQLQQFGIHSSWLERYPHELSGGELQRIALTRVMTNNTRYLIADEITASLDPNTQALIWQNLIPWIKTNQIGLLAISHDENLLARISDRLVHTFATQ